MKIYSLNYIAEVEKDLEVLFAVNGAKLTNSLFHITFRVKIFGIRARVPNNRNLLLDIEKF